MHSSNSTLFSATVRMTDLWLIVLGKNRNHTSEEIRIQLEAGLACDNILVLVIILLHLLYYLMELLHRI